jgi:hypothetical protein
MTSVAADSRRRFITGPGAASIGGLAHAAVEPTNFGAAHRRHVSAPIPATSGSVRARGPRSQMVRSFIPEMAL